MGGRPVAVIERGLDRRDAAPAPAAPRGFRPASRRRSRIAAGAVVAAIGIGGNVLLYTSLDDTIQVVQAADTIRQGEQIERGDLRIVDVELDDSVPVVRADQIDLLVGRYARTYIAAGTIVVDVMAQPSPLVTRGQGVVAVEIRPTRVPRDLRERSRVLVVVVSDDDGGLFVTRGRVVSRSDLTGGGDSDALSLSVEVAEADGPTVAAANDVRVVLLDPGIDMATEGAIESAAALDGAQVPATTEPSGASGSTTVQPGGAGG